MNRRSISLRILADLGLVLSIFMMPFWVTAILGVIFALVFENYIEIIICGIVLDLLYGVREARFHNFTFVASVGSALIYVIVLFLKSKLRIESYAIV